MRNYIIINFVQCLTLVVLLLLLTRYSTDIQSACAQNSTELSFAQRLFDDQSTSGELPFRVRLVTNSKESVISCLLHGAAKTGMSKVYGKNTY